MRQEAWVTSVVEDEDVDKAVILAGSLRRVRTAKNLVVLTTLAVSEKLRDKLKDTFDLVLLLEQKSPNGLNLENYAKLHAFSLMAYNKCVYITPNSLVLENCDEIFKKHTDFAATYTSSDDDLDLSVFVYRPSLQISRALGKIAHCIESIGDEADGNFTKQLYLWLKNNVIIKELDEKYNLRLNLRETTHRSASIVNFGDQCPLDVSDESLERMFTGDKIAIECYRRIYNEDVKNSACIFSREYTNEPIAIVGMSFRLPGGNDVDEFWSLLEEGRSAIIPVPPNRWTKDRWHAHCMNQNVEAGFLNVPIDEIDAKFFGLSPKEAEFLDPQQRLLLEVTWEALEDAMIDPVKLKGTQAGVFTGSWIHGYREMLNQSADTDFFRAYMGNSIASSAARLSHFLETTGPSIATESGCSSAIAAVDMACKSLRYGTSTVAIAGGVNLLVKPFDTKMMEFVFSPDFTCKTFDADANGFARAEACAVLVLKRLSDAEKDGDNIWGLVRGTALTQEGLSKSMGTPTVHSESLAIELALEDAGVKPNEVSYVEAHGTGTPVGDPLEILAIQKAYSNRRSEPLVIGSVKTNVGHTESVSGITGIIKVLLSMKHEVIPKHLNLKRLNPNINLESIPALIPLSPVAWPRKDDARRIAGVSSFGISGTDGHAIIEEPPTIIRHQLQSQIERPCHIMKISAKSSESMDALLEKYLTIFSNKTETNDDSERNFSNLAYSANIGRATFNHRAVIVAKNCAEAAKILREKSFVQSEVQSSGEKLCFLFTGQGSQYQGMAKQLYETSHIFRDNFDRCDNVLKTQFDIAIKKIIWTEDGNSDELSRTLYSQTSIFVVEYCLLKLWESWGVKPDFVMGHSLGEFAAAVAAGALEFEDALMLVAERSRLIDQLPNGKMLVIKADKKTVDEKISEFQKTKPNFWIDYAALNSSEQTVVAGDSDKIEEFSQFCTEQSLKTMVLAATHAFHSRHMDPILEAYRKIATTVKIPKRRIDHAKYISGMEGKLMSIESIDAEYWVKHTREKVSYTEACEAIQKEGCTLFLEVGPHPVLSAMTMLNMEREKISCLPSIRRKENEWGTMLDTLSKLYLSAWKGEVDWKGFDKFYNRDKVKLPFYPFIRKPTWAKLEPSYAKLHPLLGSILPTASSETIYQNSITLKNANFVLDHVIGNTVIFPGAGFLEICLAGGHSTVQGFTQHLIKPKRPIVLKSLKIASPLAIQDSSSCRLQTVVSLDVKEDDTDIELGYSVGVHRQEESDEGAAKWILHATAKYLPVAPSLTVKPINVSEIQSSWENWENKVFYEKLPEVGLRFGPKFQSLESGWRSEEGILVPVKVPEDYSDYIIHPVIADAMIQGIMLWTSRDMLVKKLQVPIQISEFIWLKDVESPKLYVYCSTNSKDDSICCSLVGEDGSHLAIMKGVDFVETTAKIVEGQNILGSRITLSSSHLKDCNTTKAKAATIPDITEERSRSDENKLSPQDLRILIRSDSKILSESISTKHLKKISIDEVKTVLLTGATGNLGPYMLRDLTKRKQLKTICCLVRGTSKLSGMEKLKARLEQLQLTTSVDMTKVEVIEGDITSHQFGLDEAVYLSLCEEIDAVVHCAVRSNHTAKYWKAPESKKSHVRTVNVLSTARLLEFAAERKCKHFFHASTILTLTGFGEDGQYTDGWHAVSAFDDLKISSFGYAVSKHISDQLVHQALKKGVPCKAFRFPLVSGDSKTGRVNYQQNHFVLRWLTCMKIGKIHDVPFPLSTIAVDHCAKISLDIFFNPEAPMDIYNIVQKSYSVEQVLIDVAHSFGIRMEVVSYKSFVEQLKSEDEKSPIAPFIDSYVEDEEQFISTFTNPTFPWLKRFNEEGLDFMDTSKLSKYAPDYDTMVETTTEVLKRDFNFLKNEGVFQKYGIGTFQ